MIEMQMPRYVGRHFDDKVRYWYQFNEGKILLAYSFDCFL